MTNLAVRPLSDRIVLKLDLQPMSPGGIIITAVEADERIIKAEVIAAGPGAWKDGVRQPMTVKVGDKVMFDKFTVQHLKVGDESIFIGRESELLGVIEESSNG